MNKEKFIEELIESLIYHFKSIKENTQLISFGIYTDGDASTIGIHYNTKEKLEKDLNHAQTEYTGEMFETMSLYYTFCMEEWIKDISEALREEKLLELQAIINKYGEEEYDKGNENYKDEILDLFSEALIKTKETDLFKNESNDFFIHLEVSDDFTDDKMLDRMSNILNEKRFIDFKKYSED
ncbi:DUF4303 domain-containing protein [Dokdonia sp.]|uniref:DUF4303 domain-containing protein n=1 Tax=Dokdonia sp. TaxID=2024995 RepID=UPI0032651C63